MGIRVGLLDATHGHWPPARSMGQWCRAQSRPKGAPPPQHDTNALTGIFPPFRLRCSMDFQTQPIKRAGKIWCWKWNGMHWQWPPCVDKQNKHGTHLPEPTPCVGNSNGGLHAPWKPNGYTAAWKLPMAKSPCINCMHDGHIVFGLDPKTDAHKPTTACQHPGKIHQPQIKLNWQGCITISVAQLPMVVPGVPKHASRVENEILDAVFHLKECAIKGECENSWTIFRHKIQCGLITCESTREICENKRPKAVLIFI